MRIISSFMHDLTIQKGKYHVITFESSYIQSQFRNSLLKYFQREYQSEDYYLSILNDNRDEVQSKDFYFIPCDCNVVNLQNEKSTTKIIQELLSYHLENNPDLIEEYLEFSEHIHEFISCIDLKSDGLKVDFHPSDKLINQFVKSLQISLEFNESQYVPNYILRKFLIKSLLKMNLTEKEVFLLISFPETDIGYEDFKEFIEILKNFQVTTVIITSQSHFLAAAMESYMI